MIDKRLTDLLGTQYPIIQGGMARISKPELVSAVSNAGGLGVLTSVGVDAAGFRADIQAIRRLTDKPFGVNLMLQLDNIPELLEVVKEEKPAIVLTGAGTPKDFAQDLQALGIKVIPVVSAVKHAKKMEALGVDAVVCEGQEAGGHIGITSTMATLPQVVQAVDIPVIAAGGIGSGQAIAAAECLGACGVQIGTLFLAAEECAISEAYRQQVIDAGDQDTIVTGISTGGRVRSVASPFLAELLADELKGLDPKVFLERTQGSYGRAIAGEIDRGTIQTGEVAGQVKAKSTAKAIIDRLVAEYQETVAKFQS